MFNTINHPPTYDQLVNLLVPHVSTKCWPIGLALKVRMTNIKTHEGPGCLKEVLRKWGDEPSDDKPYIWTTILDVLRSEEIDEGLLARNVQEVVCRQLYVSIL